MFKVKHLKANVHLNLHAERLCFNSQKKLTLLKLYNLLKTLLFHSKCLSHER